MLHLTLCRCYLEQRDARVILKQDAADAPHVTRVTPAQLCWREEERLDKTNYSDSYFPE